MDFSTRATGPEILDREDVGPEVFAAVMEDLASVSRVMLMHASIIGFLRRAARDVPAGHVLSVLDVGSGEGDLLRRIRRWADRRGLAVQLTGIDLNPRSAVAARARTPADWAIDYRTGDIFAATEGADIVVSSLFTHHLTDTQAVDFLRWMDRHAARGWFINDVQRHALAYHGFGVIARLARWHKIVRLDGQMSVARGFRAAEWRALLAEAGVAGVVRWRPMFRLCVEHLR